ncbi:MAG: 2-polyprenylphenol 6-hydroxylase [Rickettsiales bacterium]|nr:MAG: 2-polyprenylphenol 6-hydroxylase [Rickettsiales bacterium]
MRAGLKLLCTLCKNQILTYPPDKLKLPRHLKVFGTICGIIFYPKGLFIRPDKTYGERFSNCLYALGSIYIKFGQTLSTRPDLIGAEMAESLRYLQDRLPPFDSAIVIERIETQFGKKISELFDEFEEKPVAAASIAQVHKARLKSGELVAVKILRPDIAKKYNDDIDFLEYCAALITKMVKSSKRLKLTEVIGIFRRSMEFELDLRSEAAAASRIADNFTGDDSLCVPKIHWNLTTNDIITLEWIDGVSIYDKEAIIALGHDPKEIAAKIAVIFFNQAYRDGFFHADLHPGNIFVCKDGRVALVDFGIVGILPENDRLAIAEILFAFLNRDYALIAKVHHRIGYIPSDTNLEYFAQSCRAIAEPIIGLAIKEVSIARLLSHLFKVTEDFGMETQPQLLLLQKTMVVVEGIGQSLDEDINMWQLAEPWIKKWAAKNITPEAKILRAVKKIINDLLDRA